MPSLRATSCSRYICSIGTRSGAAVEEVIERFLLTDLALPFMLSVATDDSPLMLVLLIGHIAPQIPLRRGQ